MKSRMFPIRLDLLRMKLHYAFYMGGISSVVGFAPTIAKQLGYSPTIVGSLFTYLSFIAFIVKPILGVIVDKFPVKKLVFLTFILGSGFSAFALNYIGRVPTQKSVNLSCNKTTSLDFRSQNDSFMPKFDDKQLKLFKNNTEPIECQLICQHNKLLWREICVSWNITDYCAAPNTNDLGYFNVSVYISTLLVNTTDQIYEETTYQVESVQIRQNQVLFPKCQGLAITQCEVDCPNSILMELANVSSFNGNIFSLYQFWMLSIVLSLFWISQSVIWSLQDPICFDILGDKPEDFGEQRCWGSITWGMFSILGGVLVDYFSDDQYQKNYTPIFYLCLAIILCNFIIVSKIQVTETGGSENTFSDIYKLFIKFDVIIYCLWIVSMGIGTAMLWNYLFWYMEDITIKYHPDMQPWIKTLQGLAFGIQCIGGEMPFSFFSGRIIKKIGYWHCMSLGLVVFAIRFYLYSIITNPVWILPIELTNGITFGLSNVVMVAYARHIAPASAATSVLTIVSALFEGFGTSFGSFLGGIFYERYGGPMTFQLFSYGLLFMFVLLVMHTKFNKPN